jgi:hypothetical protein
MVAKKPFLGPASLKIAVINEVVTIDNHCSNPNQPK